MVFNHVRLRRNLTGFTPFQEHSFPLNASGLANRTTHEVREEKHEQAADRWRSVRLGWSL
jgi:hypothetical protein